MNNFDFVVLKTKYFYKFNRNKDENDENSDEEEYQPYENPFVQKFDSGNTVKSALEEEAESSLNDTYEDNEFLKSQVQTNRPISAIPPKILRQDEAIVEVSSTPAFQCLEEVNYLFSFNQFYYSY